MNINRDAVSIKKNPHYPLVSTTFRLITKAARFFLLTLNRIELHLKIFWLIKWNMKKTLHKIIIPYKKESKFLFKDDNTFWLTVQGWMKFSDFFSNLPDFLYFSKISKVVKKFRESPTFSRILNFLTNFWTIWVFLWIGRVNRQSTLLLLKILRFLDYVFLFFQLLMKSRLIVWGVRSLRLHHFRVLFSNNLNRFMW